MVKHLSEHEEELALVPDGRVDHRGLAGQHVLEVYDLNHRYSLMLV